MEVATDTNVHSFIYMLDTQLQSAVECWLRTDSVLEKFKNTKEHFESTLAPTLKVRCKKTWPQIIFVLEVSKFESQ